MACLFFFLSDLDSWLGKIRVANVGWYVLKHISPCGLFYNLVLCYSILLNIS